MTSSSDSVIRVRSLTADGEPAYVSIANESLLGAGPQGWQDYLRRIGRENMRVVFSDDRLIGGLGFYRMGQWFGGQSITTAGLSGVAIDPAFRGSRICHHMLVQTLRELASEGIPLASLFASTQTLYRGVGFEQAGSRIQYSIPLRCLPPPDRTLPCTRYESPPLDQLRLVANERGKRGNGNLNRTDGLWERLLVPYDGPPCITYVIGESDSPQGYVILKPSDRSAGMPAALDCTDWAAISPAAMRRVMTLLTDHRAMHDRIQWCGGPQDELLLFTKEAWADILDVERWLLRILNVKTALESRGFPANMNGSLSIEVTDEWIPENIGAWKIDFHDGRATVSRANQGDLQMKIQHLAPLFSGFYSASQLQAFGYIRSDNTTAVQAADQAFAGPSPWMPEIF